MGFVSSATEKSATMKLLVGLVLTTSGALSLATAITFPSDHPPVPWKPAGLNDGMSNILLKKSGL